MTESSNGARTGLSPDSGSLVGEQLSITERITVRLMDPDDPVVKEEIWPMVNASFARYTEQGNDCPGEGLSLTGDCYDVPGKSRVVAAFEGDRVLASFRIVKGNSLPEIQPGIDAELLMVSDEWSNRDAPYGEFGRFVVDPSLPRQQAMLVLRELYQKGMAYAAEHGFQDRVYVILADHVRRFAKTAGIKIEPCSASLNLGDQEAWQVFEFFPRYWTPQKYGEYWQGSSRPRPPRLYRYLPRLAEFGL